MIRNSIKNKILNIYIGEAINLLDSKNLNFENSDHLYVFSYNHIPNNLCCYEKIIFWEQYSAPVFGKKFRNERKSKQKIISNIYPAKIEKGIYLFPPDYTEIFV